MRPIRILASTLIATAVLASIVTSAVAGRLSSSSLTYRTTFARIDFAGGFGTGECQATIEGSMHTRTASKTAGALIGYITRAIVGTCPRGSATVLTATLPWHVRYASFTGTLPAISRTNFTVSGVQFRIREPVFGVQCLASGGTATAINNREAGGVLTSTEVGGSSPTDCGIEGTVSGRSTALTVLGSATRITVTLI